MRVPGLESAAFDRRLSRVFHDFPANRVGHAADTIPPGNVADHSAVD